MFTQQVVATGKDMTLHDGDRVYFYAQQSLRIHIGIVVNCDRQNGWISVKREDGKNVMIWYTELYTDLKCLLRQVLEHLDGKIDEHRKKLNRFVQAKDRLLTRFGDGHDAAAATADDVH